MPFWDASAVVPLCHRQPATSVLRRLLTEHPRPVVWWDTAVEVRSALARLLREGALTAHGQQQALQRLSLLRRSWAEVLPTEALRSLAEDLPDIYGLRAADSLQLAAALIWCRERPRGRAFICFDDRLAEAAAAAGFDVIGTRRKPVSAR